MTETNSVNQMVSGSGVSVQTMLGFAAALVVFANVFSVGFSSVVGGATMLALVLCASSVAAIAGSVVYVMTEDVSDDVVVYGAFSTIVASVTLTLFGVHYFAGSVMAFNFITFVNALAVFVAVAVAYTVKFAGRF